MKTLSVVGTAAMFLVGGSILRHGLGPLAHWIEDALAPLQGLAGALVGMLADGLLGVAAGAVLLGLWSLGQRLVGRAPA